MWFKGQFYRPEDGPWLLFLCESSAFSNFIFLNQSMLELNLIDWDDKNPY